MSLITLDVPDTALVGISAQDLVIEVKLATAMRLYDQGRFSLHQAAAFAGILAIEFRQRMGAYGISEFCMSKDQLAQEPISA